MVYLVAVEDIPAGLVTMAVKRFIRGQVQGASLTFRPAPPELAVEARRLRDQALDNKRLSALRLPKPPSTDPPDPTPEQRQRAAELLRELKAEIATTTQVLTSSRGKREWIPPTTDELAASMDRIEGHTAAQRRNDRDRA